MAATFTIPLAAAQSLAGDKAPRKHVLAFYYGWYGIKKFSGEDAHWASPDTAARKIADSPDYPVGGPYDSLSPTLVARHVSEAKAAGLTGFIASWWGQLDRTDQQFKMLLNACAKAGLKLAPYVEKADSIDLLIRDLAYLVRQYSKSRASLRYKDKTVVFVFDRILQTLGLAGWRAVRKGVEKKIGRKVFFVGTANSPEEVQERAPLFDALHIYSLQFALGKSPAFDGLSPRDHYKSWVSQQKDLAIKTATVLPGFDDTKLPDRQNPQTVLREDGQLFETLWKAAITAAPDWVLIVSYNEWHEGSQIEPSDRYGRRELETNARMSAAFLKGQPADDDDALDDQLDVSGNASWIWWTFGGAGALLGALWLRKRTRRHAPVELSALDPDKPEKT